VSLAAPDSRTIVMKLAFPDATIAAGLSAPQAGRFNILPREAEDKYDPRGTLIGSGPYYLSENPPSVRSVFKRNPAYWDQKSPYLNSIEYPIIPEYATAAAQLKAGGLYHYGDFRNGGGGIKQEDILSFKQDVPDLVLYQTPVFTNGSGIRFGYKNTDKGVFRDERLRQAYSMAVDRDLWLDVQYNLA